MTHRFLPPAMAAILLAAAAIFALPVTSAEGTAVHSSVIDPGLYHTHLDQEEDLPFTLELKYEASSEIDIYVFTSEELDDYRDGRDFSPEYKIERTVRGEKRYSLDADVRYTVVVDNMDNVRGSDAVPSGNVTYDLELEVLPFEIGVGMGLICGSIIVGGAILIIGIIWLVMKRRQMRPAARPPPDYLPPVPDPSGDPNYPPLDDDDLDERYPPLAPGGGKERRKRR